MQRRLTFSFCEYRRELIETRTGNTINGKLTITDAQKPETEKNGNQLTEAATRGIL